MLDDPPVIHVLEVITRDLLLVGGAAFVRVPERVRVVVWVEPAGCGAVGPTQRYLRAVRDLQGLPLSDGRQSTLRNITS